MRSVCKKCCEEKDTAEYYADGKYRAGHSGVCKPCTRKRVMKNYYTIPDNRREFVKEYKEEKGCCVCGITDHRVLDLHHTGAAEKVNDVATLVSKKSSLSEIKEEVDKCIVICANHHRILHHEENTHKRIDVLKYA